LNSAVIKAEGLGKRYRRNAVVDEGLRHALARTLKAPLGAFRRTAMEEFWALKDVSLEVKEGEVLGLIGRNGAGKTTLLKILSRITQPTTGWAEIHGRVGSLLEVGTGFHPELSGRENTFLSGAILGMSKSEISRKFDEIVAFAELEKFIDTPVKHYSSGMYVRLAFAVAAHLEPEILLVDEVLAVGDLNFQKKCLGKMGDVAKAGRTVVLVSHQLNQIRRLCHRVIWIDGGSIRQEGNTAEVVSAYELAMSSIVRSRLGSVAEGQTKARFLGWEFVGSSEAARHTLTSHGPVAIHFVLQVTQKIYHGLHGIALFNADRQLIWGTDVDGIELSPGIHKLRYEFSMLPLKPGPYSWLLSLFEDRTEIEMWDGVPEMIVATDSFQHQLDEWSGILNIPNKFTIHNAELVQAKDRSKALQQNRSQE
jgi:lipopolysaccharide transport system ATP-binding protein